jgi:hypothetical protein
VRRRTIIKQLPPSHPDSWDNPANEEAWLDLARAIGRKIARDQMDGLIGPVEGEDDAPKKHHRVKHAKKSGRRLRPVFKQHAKKDFD